MDFSLPPELAEIRAAVRGLCAGFPGEYWRALEPDRYPEEFVVERLYRDAPLLIIGEGSNEIQQLVIARRLLERYAV